MRIIALLLTVTVMGFALSFIGGFVFGGAYGMMFSMVSGLMMFVPLIQLVGMAKSKGFLPLYLNLGEFEKFVHFPDNFGRLKTLIVNTKHEGVCYKKHLGFIDDKGTEYCWGNSPVSFASPKLGMTVDIKDARYTELLEKNRNIEDYDDAIRHYLGDIRYKEFCKKYRDTSGTSQPDIYAINAELDRLINERHPENPLEEKVFGETWGFKHFLRFLKYAYHPQTMENAVETEKIWTKREQMGYKDVDKNISRAKAIVYVLFGLMIFIAVISSLNVNLAGILGM